MNNHKISAVIPYYSNDHKFFIECIASIYSICEKIVICVGDKLWSGLPENPEKLRELRTYVSLHKKLILKEFEVTGETRDSWNLVVRVGERLWEEPPGNDEKIKELVNFLNNNKFEVDELLVTEKKDAWYWEDYSRKQGIEELLNDDIEAILFIDTDEIIETKRMSEWLDEGHYKNWGTIQIANYWYWREKRFRSTTIEEGPLTIMRMDAVKDWYNHKKVIQGRPILFGPTIVGVTHKDGKPFAHHYSWVRTKEEMLAKTSAWGEHADRDWKKLIDDEFSKDFNPDTDKDFVHNREFIDVTKNKDNK